jgi:hypothetical protein
MRKKFIAVLFIWLFVLTGCSSNNSSPGSSLYYTAKDKESNGAYLTAYTLYTQALPILRLEGNADLVRDCRIAVKRTSIITSDYTVTEDVIRQTLYNAFKLPEDRILYFLSRIDHLDIEGTRYYYSGYADTVIHLDLSLLQSLDAIMKRNREGYSTLAPFVNTPGPVSGTPYINPVTYQATATHNIPRAKLPQKGLLKIWQPVPIVTDCQTEVTIVSISPESYVKNPASINGSLGDIYLEIPLENLTGDLQIEIKFRFKHFEQRFTMINPDQVGTYDKGSALYKEYTASAKNIFINSEIAAFAREIIGNEQNPYRAARKIYDYVVDNIAYSHLPHSSLVQLNIPESIYVHHHGYGDCGAQSMYFAALSRAVGIPARATGGYQLFPGMEGAHQWAEFYLPNYGWVPVDTSIGQIASFLPELTSAQKQAFKDYFFGSMEPYRWVIQKDSDLPFSPAASEMTAFGIILQSPAILCDEMNELPEGVLWQYYKIQFSRIP